MSKNWPERPRGLSERSYQKLMAKHKKVTVNGVDFTLQSVSPTFYFSLNDASGITGGKRDTVKYLDELFRNTIVEPAEIKAKGIAYFDELEDIDTSEKLLKEIESFLRERK